MFRIDLNISAIVSRPHLLKGRIKTKICHKKLFLETEDAKHGVEPTVQSNIFKMPSMKTI